MLRGIEERRHLWPAADAYRELPTVTASVARAAQKATFVHSLCKLANIEPSSVLPGNLGVTLIDIMNNLHYAGSTYEVQYAGSTYEVPSLFHFTTAMLRGYCCRIPRVAEGIGCVHFTSMSILPRS